MISFKQYLLEFVTSGGRGGNNSTKPPKVDWGGDGNQPHKPYKFLNTMKTPHNEYIHQYEFVDGNRKIHVDIVADTEYKSLGAFPRIGGINGSDDFILTPGEIRILEMIIIDARRSHGGYHGFDLAIETDSDDQAQRKRLYALAAKLR